MMKYSKNSSNVPDGPQAGFTLIELMISIVLGLLVIAATIQILVTSQTSLLSQQASSDIQGDGIFGLEALKTSIRAANYGAFADTDGNPYLMNKTTPGGGVILSLASSDATKKSTNFIPVISGVLANNTDNTSKKILSRSVPVTNLKAISGTLNSDQLTIQRKMLRDGFDCEGNTVSAGLFLVEKYYLKKDTTVTALAGEPEPYSLFCLAFSYGVQSGSAGSTTIGPVLDDIEELNKTFAVVGGNATVNKINNDNGTILINRVDHFHFLLGIESGSSVANIPANSNIKYIPVSSYVAGDNIVAIRFGLVVRSSNTVATGIANSDQSFDVLDQTGLTLKSDIANKAQYQRQVYESTVLIRNARGV